MRIDIDTHELIKDKHRLSDENALLRNRIAKLESKRALVSLVVKFKHGPDLAMQLPEGCMYHWNNVEEANITSIALRYEDD